VIARLRIALLLAIVAGCDGPPSVREVCENLDKQKSCFDDFSFDDCVDDGNFLEDDARGHGCEAEFDDYLACVNVTVCTADKECAVERDTLDACVGGFP
jgi:hypothetical protein